jgi:hypothetical protein
VRHSARQRRALRRSRCRLPGVGIATACGSPAATLTGRASDHCAVLVDAYVGVEACRSTTEHDHQGCTLPLPSTDARVSEGLTTGLPASGL